MNPSKERFHVPLPFDVSIKKILVRRLFRESKASKIRADAGLHCSYRPCEFRPNYVCEVFLVQYFCEIGTFFEILRVLLNTTQRRVPIG